MPNTQTQPAVQPEQYANGTRDSFSDAGASEPTEQSSAHLRDAQVDAHSIRAREAERAALRADIEAFLKSGGKVKSVAANLRVDGPRRPQNNYGKGSL